MALLRRVFFTLRRAGHEGLVELPPSVMFNAMAWRPPTQVLPIALCSQPATKHRLHAAPVVHLSKLDDSGLTRIKTARRVVDSGRVVRVDELASTSQTC